MCHGVARLLAHCAAMQGCMCLVWVGAGAAVRACVRVMGWVGGVHKGSVTEGMYRRRTVCANGGARPLVTSRGLGQGGREGRGVDLDLAR